jgi:aromatic ring hydroxylase
MLSNLAKHNITRYPLEIARLVQDIMGGLVVTMLSERDLISMGYLRRGARYIVSFACLGSLQNNSTA